MPEVTWNQNERVNLFAQSEGFGLDAWDESAWGSADWTKMTKESTVWVKES